MSAQPSGGHSPVTVAYVAGVIIFVAALAAWLFASLNHIDTTVLWTVVTPIIGALFLAPSVSRGAAAATQAAIQTNGTMSDRVEAAVSSALAKRDAARTYAQSSGDVAPTTKTPNAGGPADPPPAVPPFVRPS